jgi:O-antigen ligase
MFWSLLPAIVLVVSAWSYGAVEPCWVLLTAGTALCGVLVVVLWRCANRARRKAGWGVDGRTLAAWLAVLAYAAIQSVNRSYDFSSLDKGLTPRAYLHALPSSVDGDATRVALIVLLAGAALVGLLRVTITGQRSARVLLYLVVASSAAMAFLALLQRTGPHTSFLYPLTGRFVGENHFAAYMNLIIPVALALGRSEQKRAVARGAGSHPGYLLFLAAGTMVTAVLACGSIAGMAVCGALVLAWGVIECVRARPTWRAMAVGAGVLACVALVSVRYVGGDLLSPLKARGQLRTWKGQVCTRATVWQATLHMFGDRWVYGTGAGTFAAAFPYYQPSAVHGFYRHAHQEYLQVLAEWGVLGTGLLASLAGTLLAGPRAKAASERPVLDRTLWLGLALACAGVAMHAMVDFPMRSAAIALLVVAWLTLLGPRPAEG